MIASAAHLKLATAMMSSWMSSASPAPLPAASLALVVEAHVATPIEVQLVDANRRDTSATLVIERDGSTDPATAKQLAHLFRDLGGREHVIAPRTLAMLAHLAERYGKPIEFVSGYRVSRGESWTSPHRAARAIDFRIPGVPLTEVRDHLWRTFRGVGIGYYPYDRFLHMDTRPEDMSWTAIGGTNHYHPSWSFTARGEAPAKKPVRRRATRQRVGV